jgi:endoglucanase
MFKTARFPRSSANWITLVAALTLLLAIVPALSKIPSVKAASLCGAWDSDWTAGSNYYFQNNVWGASTAQCTNVTSSTNWSVSSSSHNNATNGAPASYPSSIKGCHSKDLNPTNGTALCTAGWTHDQVSSITALSANWTITPVSSGVWDAAFDIWYGDSAGAYNDLEIMIWFNSLGPIQPIGSRVVQGLNIDGTTWDIWSGTGGPGGNPGISWDVISYVRVTKYNGGNINLMPFQTDAIGRSGRADNNSWLTGLDVGFEIWQGAAGLATTAYSVSKTAGSAPAPTSAPSGTYYRLTNRNSGKVADVQAPNTSDGAGVGQWGWNGNTWQQWQFVATDSGYYKIVSRNSGKCLDVTGGTSATGDGVLIEQWTCNGGYNQQWRMQDMGNGYFQLVARHSSKCLDVPNSSTADGTRFQQYSCWSGTNQQWQRQ